MVPLGTPSARNCTVWPSCAGVGVKVKVAVGSAPVTVPSPEKHGAPMVGPSRSTGSSHCRSNSPPSRRAHRLRHVDPGALPQVLEAAVVERSGRRRRGRGSSPASAGRRHQVERDRPGLRAALVAGRGDVVHALGGDVVDRLGEDAVGEHRLVVVDDVVDDHVGPARPRRRRGGGCCRRTRPRPPGPWRSRAWPRAPRRARSAASRDPRRAPPRPSPPVEDGHRRRVRGVALPGQVAAGDVLRRVDRQRVAAERAGRGVVGVREGADRDARGRRSPPRGPGRPAAARPPAVVASPTLARGPDRLGQGAPARDRVERADVVQRHEALEGPAGGVDGADQQPGGLGRPAERGAVHARAGRQVHEHPALRVPQGERLLVDAEAARTPLGHPHRPGRAAAEPVAERAVDLAPARGRGRRGRLGRGRDRDDGHPDHHAGQQARPRPTCCSHASHSIGRTGLTPTNLGESGEFCRSSTELRAGARGGRARPRRAGTP